MGRTIRTALTRMAVASGLVCSMAASSAALPDQGTLQRQLGKYAVAPDSSRPKALCVCQDGGARHYKVGYLVQSTYSPTNNDVYVTATCLVPLFYGIDGEVKSVYTCTTFVPLAK